MSELLSPDTHRRNVLFLTLTEVFWGIALGLIHSQAIVTAFLDDLGSNAFFIGLVNTAFFVSFAISQIMGGYVIEKASRRKMYVVGLHFLAPIPWLAIFIATMLLVNPPKGLVAGRFSVLLSTIPYGALMGMLVPIYFAYISAIVREKERGHAMGVMFASQCLCGALTVYYVGKLTAKLGFPTNYATLFAAAAGVVFLGNLFLLGTKEPVPRSLKVRRPVLTYLRSLADILRKSQPLRVYILARCFLVANGVMVYFFVKEAKTMFGFEGTEWARLFAFFFLLGQATGNQIFGRVADRVGYVEVAMGGILVGLAGGLFAVLVKSVAAFLIAQMAAGAYVASDWLSHMNISISFAPTDKRAHYIGIANLLVSPVYGTAMLLGGYIMDKWHLSGLLILLTPTMLPGIILMFLKVRPNLKSAQN